MNSFLPMDLERACLLGRMDFGLGPSPVVIRRGRLFDLTRTAPTVADVLNLSPERTFSDGDDLGPFDPSSAKPTWTGGTGLLAPIDLQCVKAAGVTFAASTLERVLEEAARGDQMRARSLRDQLTAAMGAELRAIRPGSKEATKLKSALIEKGLWSQYLEVAIGVDAEIFTKAPVLSSVGWGGPVGIRSDSSWNNPEPEIVIVCDGKAKARGATLGNDVNLRDIEGRSALLLGQAKDNTASCAVGPFIRLFDEHFSMDHVRKAVIDLEVAGDDGFRLRDASDMGQISRDPEELIAQTAGPNHQYPDGFALFCGTMFAPVQDRGAPGRGFTHSVGDIVRISSPALGALENRVVHCSDAPPWTFGVGALMRNLGGRGLI